MATADGPTFRDSFKAEERLSAMAIPVGVVEVLGVDGTGVDSI